MIRELQRARRRRDLERMKAKARRVYPDVPQAPKWADHLAVCSCALCSRSRKFLGPTVQERRWNSAYTEQAAK